MVWLWLLYQKNDYKQAYPFPFLEYSNHTLLLLLVQPCIRLWHKIQIYCSHNHMQTLNVAMSHWCILLGGPTWLKCFQRRWIPQKVCFDVWVASLSIYSDSEAVYGWLPSGFHGFLWWFTPVHMVFMGVHFNESGGFMSVLLMVLWFVGSSAEQDPWPLLYTCCCFHYVSTTVAMSVRVAYGACTSMFWMSSNASIRFVGGFHSGIGDCASANLSQHKLSSNKTEEVNLQRNRMRVPHEFERPLVSL